MLLHTVTVHIVAFKDSVDQQERGKVIGAINNSIAITRATLRRAPSPRTQQQQTLA